MVAPFLAVCLREAGLNAHLVHRTSELHSIDNASCVLTPAVTSYLTEDLQLSAAKPPGNMITAFYTYDHTAHVLMNLNLEPLRPPDGGTFFCCHRKVVERLLLRECQRPQVQLRGGTQIRVFNDNEVVKLSQGHGGVSVQLKRGSSGSVYRAVLNCSRDVDAVPLLNPNHEAVSQKRDNMRRQLQRATTKAPFFLDWTIPVPSRDQGQWELQGDEVAEIVHRSGRKLYVRPVNDTELAVTMTAPRRGRVDGQNTTPAQHFKTLMEYWSRTEAVRHDLFTLSLVPALQEAVRNTRLNKVNFSSPTYCFEDWAEEGDKIIRVGPAAHGCTIQTIDIADAVDFKDCFMLAEHLSEHGTEDIDEFLMQRRVEVIDEINALGKLDDFAFRDRGKLSFFLQRSKALYLKTFSRAWKRALRPFC